jgi:nucleotide-binding universal stress UspA family protein
VWTYAHGKMLDGKPAGDIKKIVCALELNDEAVRLLRFVSDIGTEFGASVRLIHSVPDDASRPYRYFDSDLHRFLLKLAEEEISKLQTEAGTYFNVDFVELPVGQATAIAAAQQQADLVVIGRGTTQGVLGTLRTHAYDIIREAHCPVLSYCAEEAETDGEVTSTRAIGKQLLTRS